MTAFVVDTNVAIVANGGDGVHADEQCQLTCVMKLERLIKEQVVAVDVSGCILEEYRNHLCESGRPGTGDLFFKYVFDNQYQDARVKMVEVNPICDDRRGFKELPDNTFDRSDRKFLAVAVAASAIVLNATDSDWNEHKSLTDRLGVEVSQLCLQYASKETS